MVFKFFNAFGTKSIFFNTSRYMNLRAFFFGVDLTDAPIAPVSQVDMQRPEGLRYYLKAVPTKAPNDKRPLVIVLHGGGASATQVFGMAFPPSPLSVWLEIAEREQVVVIAPNGNSQRGKRAWNDGFADIKTNPTVDDVGFIDAIIDRAINDDAVDPERVYVIGVSKGGMLAYRLAIELAPRLAAFSAVLAGMPERATYAAPTHALSALIVGSTADPFIPYSGGKFPYTLWFMGPMLGIESTVEVWRTLAKLPDAPSQLVVGSTIRDTWGDNASSLQVVLLKIIGGGHAEPSRKKRYPGLFKYFPGRQSADLEIAEEAWAFFKEKRRTMVG